MKRIPRVMILTHPLHRPDRAGVAAGTERDVYRTLRRLPFAVECVSASDDLREFDRRLVAARPDVVFNLLEEFRGEGVYDFHLVSHLEALGIPCTGCNPRGLILSRGKFTATQLAQGLGARTPATSRARAPAFPAIVKFDREHASRGITRENVVTSAAAFRRVRRRMRRSFGGEIVAQAFVRGAEVSVPVLGNARPRAFAPWRLHLPPDRIATEKMKFDSAYRLRSGVRARRLSDPALAARLRAGAVRLFRGFELSGYARFDYRITADGEAFLIDVNANPNLARDEDFAMAARADDLGYPELLTEIIRLARTYRPPR